jgi:crotonobetainyl-CoA:carnitine CoA-transferase CaiB-like acyl-CoA transferase
MLSTCNMGQTGPRADTPGFGSQLSAFAGICGLTGPRDGPPMLLYGPYVDFIASTLGAAAVLAALERRRRTGVGAFLDVSQYESALSFLAGQLLDYHVNGRVAERAGNADAVAAPHGAYPCADATWVALSCWSDAEFERLALAIGRRDLCNDGRFATVARRHADAADIDSAIESWTRGRTATHAAEALQAADIRAHAVNTVADLFSDPQLVHRRQWRLRRHPVIGDQAYFFPAFDLRNQPGDITAPAPLLGADNKRVFGEFLGLPDDELEMLRAAGAFD